MIITATTPITAPTTTAVFTARRVIGIASPLARRMKNSSSGIRSDMSVSDVTNTM